MTESKIYKFAIILLWVSLTITVIVFHPVPKTLFQHFTN